MVDMLVEDGVAQTSYVNSKRGGWVTFPFIIGVVIGTGIAAGGWLGNLVVFLIQEFSVGSIKATQIGNVLNGCVSLFPVVGAIIADSLSGCYLVIATSSCICVLGLSLFNLIVWLDSLRPQHCEKGSSMCPSPSKTQLSVLYLATVLATIGIGGTRFIIGTMGANQFNKTEDQEIFFNWYFFTMYFFVMLSGTAVVYIEDNMSWRWGFGICLVANAITLAIFLFGNRFYRHTEPQGSPFLDLGRVLVATIRKMKVPLSNRIEDYYCSHDGAATKMNGAPSKSFRFLNRAALITEGDITSDGLVARKWRLCTMQQVEDLKSLIRIFPVWSSNIFLSTPIGIIISLAVLQALTMDRHLGSHFKIPAGSFPVVVILSASFFIPFIDRFLCPTWHKLVGRPLTPIQRIGSGHVFNMLGITVSAIVEAKRLKIAHAHIHNSNHKNVGFIVPVSGLWLFPQLVLLGMGEAFHFPGNVSLYYKEFPSSLKGTATAMAALTIGIAFYLGTAIVDLVRRVTNWLPDDINYGRLDNVYWTVLVIGVLNFFYFLVCARLYNYQNFGKEDNSSTDDK
ncbi:Proton-dependent oligopeptide transporter family [Dillenia turbinata]|uniref:Proton-dependent oligopeptide transporter family n=1 Tax=Dillenia turbinata TaxID=194707 RepID=A0AAN8VUF4_9MAGN